MKENKENSKEVKDSSDFLESGWGCLLVAIGLIIMALALLLLPHSITFHYP